MFIRCFSICAFVVIIIAVSIGVFVRKSNKKYSKIETTADKSDKIKTEFETLKFNAKVIDLNCRVEMVGIKQPKSVTLFTVCFETENNERIKMDVPQEMYNGLEIGQKGELTLVDGELYSFIV